MIMFARLIAMKAGGQNLDELTKFCKELAKKVKLYIAEWYFISIMYTHSYLWSILGEKNPQKINVVFLVAKLLYTNKCPSICP